MRGFARAQMRQNLGRLLAAGLAVAIATAFVAATLLVSNIFERTTYDAIGARFADADLVVTGSGLTEDVTAQVRATDGVAAADGVVSGSMTIESGASFTWLPTVPRASDPALEVQELVDGALPGAGEIAVPVSTAERLGIGVGDRLTATFTQWYHTGTGRDAPQEYVDDVRDVVVSGIVADPRGAYLDSDGAAVIDAADARARIDGGELWADHVLVALAPGTSIADGRTALLDEVRGSADDLAVRTRDQQTDLLVAQQTGQTGLMTAVVLGFGAVAMVVASFVIANTFAVLVAQRRRTLALLRCVGASRRQLRRTVTSEAAVLGLVAATVGVLLGAGLTQLALSLLRDRVPEVPMPATIAPTLTSTLVPLALGTLVTIAAAFAPARAAGRVAPIAALRPAAAPSAAEPGSRSRLVTSLALTLVGGGLLALAVVASFVAGPLVAVLVGVVGGAVSFGGVLLGAVFWLPRLLGAAGAVVARVGGPTTALAAANAVRNPRRTAATASALLIGVTLVTMMSTGAASARQSLMDELDGLYPVDVEVRSYGSATMASTDQSRSPWLATDVIAAMSAVDGVEQVVPMTTFEAMIRQDDGDYHLVVHAADPQEIAEVARGDALTEGLGEDTIVVPSSTARSFALQSGDVRTLTVPDDEGAISDDGPAREVTVLVRDLPGWAGLATPELAAALAPDVGVTTAWIRVQDTGDAAAVTSAIRDLLHEKPVQITGASVERAMFDRFIDTALAIVVGLLGVAVVIALVGVANTLSLAVIERRRESATLRAVGLTKRGLRRSLAIEGALITVGGAAFGTVLGTLYGWAGARTLTGAMAGSAPLVVAWRDVAIVLVVALVAGVMASVLPARSAVRTSPVAALGTE